jgi:hypothetical protein
VLDEDETNAEQSVISRAVTVKPVALQLALTALVPLIIVIVAIVAVALAGRGKMLKCPDCGTVFAAPAMDNKRSGMGWTLPHMGKVKCPKCGEARPRRDYQKVPSTTESHT